MQKAHLFALPLALAVCCLPHAGAQNVPTSTVLTGTSIKNDDGSVMAAGLITFRPNDCNGHRATLTYSGGSYNGTTAVVTNGGFSVNLPTPSSGGNFCYQVGVQNTLTGASRFLTGYGAYAPASGAVSFDSAPTTGVLPDASVGPVDLKVGGSTGNAGGVVVNAYSITQAIQQQTGCNGTGVWSPGQSKCVPQNSGTGGSSINWQADYVAATAYSINDAVAYNGSSYLSLQNNNVGKTPATNPDSWALIAQAGLPGPAGPIGATGVQGTQGLQGIQGIQGTPGTPGTAGTNGQGFTNRGAWAANTAYNAYDVLTNGGQTYVVASAFTSGTTFDDSNLGLWASKGIDGAVGPQGPAGLSGGGTSVPAPSAYNAGTTYAQYFLATYNGVVYQSLQANNTGNTPVAGTTTAYWAPYAAAAGSGSGIGSVMPKIYSDSNTTPSYAMQFTSTGAAGTGGQPGSTGIPSGYQCAAYWTATGPATGVYKKNATCFDTGGVMLIYNDTTASAFGSEAWTQRWKMDLSGNITQAGYVTSTWGRFSSGATPVPDQTAVDFQSGIGSRVRAFGHTSTTYGTFYGQAETSTGTVGALVACTGPDQTGSCRTTAPLTSPLQIAQVAHGGNIGTAIASASTIALVAATTHITGTTPIATITPPTACVTTGTGCEMTLIVDGAWSLATGGNIALAVTPTVGARVGLTYDPAVSKWYPGGGSTSSGGSLPPATAAGQVPVSNGAGNAYTVRSLTNKDITPGTATGLDLFGIGAGMQWPDLNAPTYYTGIWGADTGTPAYVLQLPSTLPSGLLNAGTPFVKAIQNESGTGTTNITVVPVTGATGDIGTDATTGNVKVTGVNSSPFNSNVLGAFVPATNQNQSWTGKQSFSVLKGGAGTAPTFTSNEAGVGCTVSGNNIIVKFTCTITASSPVTGGIGRITFNGAPYGTVAPGATFGYGNNDSAALAPYLSADSSAGRVILNTSQALVNGKQYIIWMHLDSLEP